jgi:hypothetical protein
VCDSVSTLADTAEAVEREYSEKWRILRISERVSSRCALFSCFVDNLFELFLFSFSVYVVGCGLWCRFSDLLASLSLFRSEKEPQRKVSKELSKVRRGTYNPQE